MPQKMTLFGIALIRSRSRCHGPLGPLLYPRYPPLEPLLIPLLWVARAMLLATNLKMDCSCEGGGVRRTVSVPAARRVEYRADAHSLGRSQRP